MSVTCILYKQNVRKSLHIIAKRRNFALERLRKATAVNINKVKRDPTLVLPRGGGKVRVLKIKGECYEKD